MAITYDNASSLAGIGVSSLTFSHINAGDYMFGGAGNYQPGTQVVNSITYNGVSLTEIHESAGTDMNAAIYEKVAPYVGTANVVATWSASADEVCAGVVTLAGVNQSTPRRGTYALANGTSTTASVNISSAVNDWVIDFVACSDPNGITGGAGQIEEWSRENVDGYSSYGSSTEAGAATTTMSWTLVASTEWRIYAVSLQPAGGTTHEVSISEAATASEVVNSAGNIFSSSRTEAATAAESLSSLLTTLASITETANSTESSDRLFTTLAAITEAANSVESSDRLLTMLASISESVTATDVSDRLLITLAAITEAATASDESDFLGQIHEAAITETATASDLQSVLLILVASILEAVTSEDSHDALRTTIASIIETNTADDISNAAKIVISEITEAATAEEILSSVLIIVADIIESGIPLDSFDSIKIAVASIIEAGSASDLIDAAYTSERTGAAINIELLRRKKRLEFILAEDEELLMAVAAAMEVIKNKWVH